ncbi:MAG: hypothetical protein WCF28_00975 [Methanobacterium sp.]|uniref:hypothetical protein n=1 Tax=Methanobacterium sp. TaxID=2164 RepID=UPI003C72970E
MGITREIESITIDFEEPYQLYGESVIKEVVGNVKNDREIIKIEVSSAIFIYREYLGTVFVDVIPFHQIKNCATVLKCEKE